MIINVKHKKKHQITLDLRCAQIRYLKNVDKKGKILFERMESSDIEAYTFLWEHDKPALLRSLAKDVQECYFGIAVKVADLEIIEGAKVL